jgi:hypothetical protein
VVGSNPPLKPLVRGKREREEKKKRSGVGGGGAGSGTEKLSPNGQPRGCWRPWRTISHNVTIIPKRKDRGGALRVREESML